MVTGFGPNSPRGRDNLPIALVAKHMYGFALYRYEVGPVREEVQCKSRIQNPDLRFGKDVLILKEHADPLEKSSLRDLDLCRTSGRFSIQSEERYDRFRGEL